MLWSAFQFISPCSYHIEGVVVYYVVIISSIYFHLILIDFYCVWSEKKFFGKETETQKKQNKD